MRVWLVRAVVLVLIWDEFGRRGRAQEAESEVPFGGWCSAGGPGRRRRKMVPFIGTACVRMLLGPKE